MTPTVPIMLRLHLEEAAALDRAAPRGEKTSFIRNLIRAELERRGLLKPPAGKLARRKP